MIWPISFLLALGGIATAQESTPDYQNPLLAKVLLYTYTNGFRHDSIPVAIQQLKAWGPYYNISFDATEDQKDFTVANLAKYDALLFVHTTENNKSGQNAFVDYLSKGGNFAGVHAASVAFVSKTWPPWTDTLGSSFDHHPARQTATFVKEATGHPATNPTPDRPLVLGAKLLFSVDPTSYKENNVVKEQGTPHPIAWYQEYAAGAVIKPGTPGPGVAGRSFFSSLGHNNSTWMDDTFMKHIMGGLSWTLASNTTRVSAGLYGASGIQPTVRIGASNANASSIAASPWSPVLGSTRLLPLHPHPSPLPPKVPNQSLLPAVSALIRAPVQL
ncbi:Trehalose utilization [Rhizoctonia solani]|uniref:Trehalose utilization n=1 Tax=Rhizoctonia solani TaxID=456999 RepID=A0A8H7IG28_9AGAM|nr:Trehalose utilization [Rhizoctonia solani]